MVLTSDVQQILRHVALPATRPRVTAGLLPEVTHQAVYDLLRALTSAGPVPQIQPAVPEPSINAHQR